MCRGNRATVRILIEQMYYKFEQMSRADSDLSIFSILTQQKGDPTSRPILYYLGRVESIVQCRGGVLPVGETSRSDRGGGVSAEECSSRNFSNQCHPNAEQINFSVGYGACDVPSFSATCHPYAEQIPVSVGMFLSRRRHPSVAMRHLPLGEITLVIRRMTGVSAIETIDRITKFLPCGTS